MPSITLTWQKTPNVTSYLLFRKSPNQLNWGSPLKSLSGADTSYIDTKVSVGTLYKYRIDKTGSNFSGNGYITAGIDIAAIEKRGVIIVAIDSLLSDSLALEIATLFNDLAGDGYTVKYFYISSKAAVTKVKEKIRALYNEDSTNTTSLLLLGHIPVPYSGALNPDGHGDHIGAWPTDMFYSDLDGTWTDNITTSTEINSPRIVNKIGDGKFDQSIIDGNLELQTGRIDFYDMPAFAKSEIELMRAYLNKNHAYRHKIFSVAKKAVIDDNFGYFNGEAFAASGYNNFSNLVGSDNIKADDYFTSLSNEGLGYLWAYGCGGGWYNGAGGVGSTDDFAKADLNNVFTLLFGSYFGDWDVKNSFLRAPLAQGKTLTCSWSGRPHHQYHHMTLGQSIGYSFTTTLNNNNYFPNTYGISGKWIHNNLMGDPTLRNDVIAPPTNLALTPISNGVKINWQPSSENNVSYRLYYKKIKDQQFTLLVDKDSFTYEHVFECIKDTGAYVFTLRAVKLISTPAGTYYNISQAVFDTIVILNLNIPKADFSIEGNGKKVQCENKSVVYDKLYWSCSNGQTSNDEDVEFTFDTSGIYTITLVTSNTCYSDTTSKDINIIISNTTDEMASDVVVYPVPASDYITLLNHNRHISNAYIIDASGRRKKVVIQSNNIISLEGCGAGYYLIELLFSDGNVMTKSLEIFK